MTNSTTSRSGTSKPTGLLPFPVPLPYDHTVLKDMLCYIIRGYKWDDGRSVLIHRGKESSLMLIGNTKDEAVDVNVDDKAQELLKSIAPKLYNVMKHIKLPQAQFYFSNDLKLFDVRISANKFTGPGMLRDVFSTSVETQEVIKITNIDDATVKALSDGKHPYDGELMIKPSRYREADAFPLYMLLTR